MTVRQTIWGVDDRAQRQRISHEVQQLRQMSKTLRTTAMRSFRKRVAAADIKPPEAPVKPTSVAA
ncbi:hypothetical protein [Reyranella sp.]|jgi:hypothetical protein|uniref:hypothetical protein n=1 Tax=Reyranella sp. TaxID=1929291 RepID=UPI003D0FFCFA